MLDYHVDRSVFFLCVCEICTAGFQFQLEAHIKFPVFSFSTSENPQAEMFMIENAEFKSYSLVSLIRFDGRDPSGFYLLLPPFQIIYLLDIMCINT